VNQIYTLSRLEHNQKEQSMTGCGDNTSSCAATLQFALSIPTQKVTHLLAILVI